MKLIHASATNFASYAQLDFNFNQQGLTLIEGPTGSGKSTLCDLVPWILFGKTSKNGTADEIISWPGDKVTQATLTLEGAAITRIRGKGKNDLYFVTKESAGLEIRGKDLLDTQKLINALLGLDIDLYLSGAYFHEFSQTAQFFTTTPKNRRLICEQIVDLSLAKKIQTAAALKLKENRLQVLETQKVLTKHEAIIEAQDSIIKTTTARIKHWELQRGEKVLELKAAHENWDHDQKNTIIYIKENFDTFEVQRKKTLKNLTSEIAQLTALVDEREDTEAMALEAISALVIKDAHCEACGQAIASEQALQRQDLLKSIEISSASRSNYERRINEANKQLSAQRIAVNPFKTQLEQEKKRTNTHGPQLLELIKETNPHKKSLQDTKNDQKAYQDEAASLAQELDALEQQAGDLNLLSDIIAEFRNTLITNTILQIEERTNALLEEYFDSEVKLTLLVTDNDKLDVTITKDGNVCSFTQLSKGQRGILKACFGVSVMKAVSNHHGIQLNALFFDEALDGLDDNFKVKAIRMLEVLASEYESVFVVEHSETVKALLDKKVSVRLVNGASQIEK